MAKRRARGFGPAGKRRRVVGRQVIRYQAPAPAPRGYRRFSDLDSELKFHDVTVDDAVIASGGTIQNALLTIPEGIGEEQRVGRKLVIKSISWKIMLRLPSTATANNTSDTVRIMLIQDKQANGALPAVTDILASDDFQSFNSMANSQRFKTLWTRTVALNAPAGSGRGSTDTLSYGNNEQALSFHKNCNIAIEYDSSAATGAITTIRSNNIFVLLLSRLGVCAFVSEMRFRFYDR